MLRTGGLGGMGGGDVQEGTSVLCQLTWYVNCG